MPRKPKPESVPKEDDEELDLAIIFLRVALRWKQKDLAEKSKIGNSSISDYERRKKNPGRQNLRKLLRAMGYRESVLELTRWYLNQLRTTQRLTPGEMPPSGGGSPVQLPEGVSGPGLSRPDQVPAEFGRAAEQVIRALFELLRVRSGDAPAPSAVAVEPAAEDGETAG